MTSKKTGKKGFETEEMVRSYFLAAGFFVVRGVKLRQGGDDLTDIDLWIYERSATLARRRIIIDVKDNAQPKAPERLFFVKGLAQIVQVEAVGIVTSDSRRPLRELARKHNVLWIDNADLQRLKSSEKLATPRRLSDEQISLMIANADRDRSSKNIRETFDSVKSSVANRFGPASANTAIEGASFFAGLAIEAHPQSVSAEVFTRLTYFCVAIAAAALDFASGDFALRPHQERLAHFAEAIRFGEDATGTVDKLRWTMAAIRDFAPDGAGLAEVVRTRFNSALRALPVEGLAEVAAKMSSTDRLFVAARDLEDAAYSKDTINFDRLTIGAKTILGAVLDFTSRDRLLFAAAVHNMPPAEDGTRGENASETKEPDRNGKLI